MDGEESVLIGQFDLLAEGECDLVVALLIGPKVDGTEEELIKRAKGINAGNDDAVVAFG